MSSTIIQATGLKGKGPHTFTGDVRFEGALPEGIIINVQGNATFTGSIGKNSHITATGACEVVGYVYSDCSLTSTQGDIWIASASSNLVVASAGSFTASGQIGEKAQITAAGDCELKDALGKEGRIEASSVGVTGYVYSDCSLTSTQRDIRIASASNNLIVASAGRFTASGQIGEKACIAATGTSEVVGELGKESRIEASSIGITGYVYSDCSLTSTLGDIRIASASNNLIVASEGGFTASGRIGEKAQITAAGDCELKDALGKESRIEASSIGITGYVYSDCALTSAQGDICINGASANLTVESAGAFKNAGAIGANPKIVENHNPESRKWQKLAKNRAEEVTQRGGSIFDGGDDDGVGSIAAPANDGETKFAPNTGPKTPMDWGITDSTAANEVFTR